jgi:RNA polymerase sigma-70 factor (ECF subfamily)
MGIKSISWDIVILGNSQNDFLRRDGLSAAVSFNQGIKMNFRAMFGLESQRERDSRWEDFESEVMPFSGDLFRVAMWLTRNREEAEDLVQETLFQALRSFHRYEVGTNCRAWLMTIMHNLNAKRVRSLAKFRLVEDPDERLGSIPIEAPMPQEIADDEIKQAINAVPEQFRYVILLADVEELSYKEISDILNIPIGTVMSRLFRARRLLRASLAKIADDYGIGVNRRAAEG